ncbi:MAG: hypothetical protein J3R72DRAFT_430335 [Linnemannia gamsii]|nr:MAG: hypothetical protein J3R72DRAFT_430335 [Linnemannia gamsii]
MVQAIDLSYHWPRFAVASFSFFGILSGFDMMLPVGIVRTILHLDFRFSHDIGDYIFGLIIIIINLVSLLAAVLNSNRIRASMANSSIYLLLVHFLAAPFIWFLLFNYTPERIRSFSWFAIFLQLFFEFILMLFRAWATIVMWRDTRAQTRNAWGALVDEDGVHGAIVHPAPVQLP